MAAVRAARCWGCWGRGSLQVLLLVGLLEAGWGGIGAGWGGPGGRWMGGACSPGPGGHSGVTRGPRGCKNGVLLHVIKVSSQVIHLDLICVLYISHRSIMESHYIYSISYHSDT